MRSYHFLTLSIVILVFAGFLVFAQEPDPLSEITFPVPELGNCQNKQDCENHCEKPENAQACLDFAQVHNLLSREEIETAREMLALGETEGPGGCQGKVECEIYCDDISHIEECLSFAEKHNLIPPEELEEARKFTQAIKQGVKPPDCKNKEECDIYCSQPENMKECLIFAEAAGLIPPDELEEAKKMLGAIEKGAKPPPCQGKAECDIYCEEPEHFEECLTFAEAAGFISAEEAAMARLTGGKGPGDCRGEECETYCDDPSHMEECLNFAIEYGLIPPEEAEQAKKMLAAGLTAGPRGCRNQTECEAYCNDLANMAECVDFAEKAGFMSEEDASRARKMAEMGIMGGPGGCQGEEECRAFCDNPANIDECLDFAVKVGEMTPEEAERARQGMEMMQRGGPGGCKTEKECKAYCDDPSHMEECISFGQQIGEISPTEAQEMRQKMEMMQRGGPGGCKTEEECRAYCENPVNLTECINFGVEQGQMSPEKAKEILEMMQMKSPGKMGLSPIIKTRPLDEMMKQPSKEEMGPQFKEMMEPAPEEMMKKPSESEMKPYKEMPAPNSGEKIEPSPEQKMELQGLLELFQLVPFGQAGSSPQSFLHPLTQFLADISAVLKF